MDTWLKITTAVAAVFAILGVGAFVRIKEWLTEEADHSLMRVVIRVLVPCLIITNVLGNPALKNAENLLAPPLLGVGFFILGLVVCTLWVKWMPKHWGLTDAIKTRTFILTTGMYNFYYLPLAMVGPPLVETEDQAKAVRGVLMILMVGMELSMWTLGVLVLTGGLKPGWWKHLINPPALTVIGCVILNFASADQWLHPGIMRPIQLLGQCAVPLGLMLIGATIADELKNAHWKGSGWIVANACLLRLIILPALFLLLIQQLSVSKELHLVLVMEAAMPAAMFPILLTRLHQGDLPTALRVVIGTSLVGLLTIPLWLALGGTSLH